MKEAFAESVLLLALLGVAWIILIFVAIAIGTKQKSFASAVFIILSIASLPGYIGFQYWHEKYSIERLMENQRRMTNEAISRFRQLCAQPNNIVVYNVVEESQPVSISVGDTATFTFNHERDPLFYLQGRYSCWLSSSPECTQSDVGNVGKLQSERNSARPSCEGLNPMRDCHTIREIDLKLNTSKPVLQLDAAHSLGIFKTVADSPLINQYEIRVWKTATSKLLAKAIFYSRTGFGYPEEKPESRFCPDRDPLIAEVLRKVFPIPKGR